MSNDIYRILKRHFGYRVDDDSLNDFDVFMERFGQAISMEIMCIIFNAMQQARKENDGTQEFRFDLTLEKSKQFKSFTGEYIG
ncbi:MAG TPA: hypothetical protein VFE53_06435 [Mucilaginibacter sp.]|jgi:hypothetical protein|nr:hypothetical protein [Mucilaginibacter sp.]